MSYLQLYKRTARYNNNNVGFLKTKYDHSLYFTALKINHFPGFAREARRNLAAASRARQFASDGQVQLGEGHDREQHQRQTSRCRGHRKLHRRRPCTQKG